MAESHRYLARFPLPTWESLEEEASKTGASINSIVVQAVEAHLSLDGDTAEAVSFYTNSRAVASDLLRSFSSAAPKGDSSYDLAIQALAGAPEEKKQDGISEESGN